MADSRIFGQTYEMIGKSMDISSRRHNLITGNIANIDTIGYTPSDIDFQSALKRAMTEPEPDNLDKTNEKHLPGNIDGSTGQMNSMDSEDVDIYHLNSVNIDTEMMNLMENNIKFRSTAEMLLRKMTILNYAIDEGGK
ncbi:flagellar basal body rod protein FlgB [Desulfobacter latus]|uniref:Flagellar basal body rod protein FlgB n=1 Tax=Desulfobacter latus TaxID=2292 RepID=A0A850T3U5_9BACT|nr:flagellar basal body rod protein FlgB [Desulfobacter latus]NWH03485.1 flagellar basal body rod protein FlgB [Desulfobacter latus]